MTYFRARCSTDVEEGVTQFKVRRESIMEDAFDAVMCMGPEDMKRKLMIFFGDEQGIDYGGISREFFICLSKELFSPCYGLFEYSSQDCTYTLQINPCSEIANSNHLAYFWFIGRILGMAIFHSFYLEGYFIRTFYKKLLKIDVLAIEDIEGVDSGLYNGLVWMLSNSIENTIFETMSVIEDRYDTKETIEFVSNGASIQVTDTNKMAYVE